MKLLLFFFYFFLISTNSFASKILYEGLKKLSIADLQSLTSVDIYKDDISLDEVNLIVKELYNSDLIYEINLKQVSNNYILTINENKLIENIYINGNINIKDQILKELITSKKNDFISKDKISSDLNLIRNLYTSKGYVLNSYSVTTELYSEDKVNLIFTIQESNPSFIRSIKIKGNKSFSSKFLLSKIISEPESFLNIFSKGSNINKELFEFDLNNLRDFYTRKGFFDIKLTYQLQQISNDSYVLNFYIDEGDRYSVDEIVINLDDKYDFSKIFNDLKKSLSKNDLFYDYEIIQLALVSLNDQLFANNIINKKVIFNYIDNTNGSYILEFSEIENNPVVINDININGNVITKSNVIRSKININPGDYLNEDKIKSSVDKLSSYAYLNKVEYKINSIDQNKADIEFNVDENPKTGNLLLAGTVSGDTGLGFNLGAKDNNFLGTGNNLNTRFSINSEQILFDVNYKHYPLNNSNIYNSYTLENSETDLTSSYGFKNQSQSAGYNFGFNYSEDTNISVGYLFSKEYSHSPTNNTDLIINDNIGTFYNSIFSMNIKIDKTNDLFFPTNGYKNFFSISFAPKEISDEAFVKTNIGSDIYHTLNNTNNFIFFVNDFGAANSLSGNLKSRNTFSLGGLNFKGFDYRGLGKTNSNNIYLGGNNYFTSTLGYGSSFLFDEKDNIYIRLFYTTGSLWKNDYEDIDFKLRSSIGASFDFLTVLGPISIYYAVPIQKISSDRTQKFNFTIGSSF